MSASKILNLCRMPISARMDLGTSPTTVGKWLRRAKLCIAIYQLTEDVSKIEQEANLYAGGDLEPGRS